jgi:hypothetical protein
MVPKTIFSYFHKYLHWSAVFTVGKMSSFFNKLFFSLLGELGSLSVIKRNKQTSSVTRSIVQILICIQRLLKIGKRRCCTYWFDEKSFDLIGNPDNHINVRQISQFLSQIDLSWSNNIIVQSLTRMMISKLHISINQSAILNFLHVNQNVFNQSECFNFKLSVFWLKWL